MTDNEIIKALECCKKLISGYNNCPYYNNDDCQYELLVNSLDLINRQKAEIERLHKEHGNNFEKWILLDNKTKQRYAELYAEAKEVVKSEAIKEFVDKAIERICEKVNAPTPTESYIVERCNQEIDSLAAEMTEVNENDRV